MSPGRVFVAIAMSIHLVYIRYDCSTHLLENGGPAAELKTQRQGLLLRYLVLSRLFNFMICLFLANFIDKHICLVSIGH
jgi:hypothetical protein